MFEKLFEGHRVEDVVGGFGELVVDEAYRDFAGRKLAGGRGLADGEAAFQAPDEIADADFARGSRKPIPSAAANFAFEEPAAAEGEQDRFQKFVGKILLPGQIARLDEFPWPKPGKLDDGAQAVFSSLGKPQKSSPGRKPTISTGI